MEKGGRGDRDDTERVSSSLSRLVIHLELLYIALTVVRGEGGVRDVSVTEELQSSRYSIAGRQRIFGGDCSALRSSDALYRVVERSRRGLRRVRRLVAMDDQGGHSPV